MKPTPEAFDADRELWLAIRRALLAVVRAIERRWGIDPAKKDTQHG